METIEDFATAVEVLQNAHFVAPQYFIMSGSQQWQAAVLTISRHGQEKGCATRLGNEADWLLLQTNDDYCGKAEDLRRPIANFFAKVSSLSADSAWVNASSVLNIMIGFPLMTPLTAFTWVAMPATGFHETVLPRQPIAPPANLRARHPSWRSKFSRAQMVAR